MNNGGEHPLAECERLSDVEVVQGIRFLAERTRHNEIRLLSHLAEFDSRRLCLEEGYRSAYEYCTIALGFEEAEAYRRIRASRIIRAFPEAFAALQARKITVSALVVLSPWLQRDNAAAWIKEAEGKSKRELEALVAMRYPQAPQPDYVRNLPNAATIVSSAPPKAFEVGGIAAPTNDPPDGGRQVLAPVAAERVRVGFDAPTVVGQLLERMRQLLRHKYPEGRLEDLVREALEDYLDRKDPQRKLELKAAKAACVAEPPAAGMAERPPARFLRTWAAGRYIPAKVKSDVWARDDGRCAWRDKNGTVCGSKDWIEYDHVTPFAKGGRSDDPRNLRLVCRQHNQAAALAAGFSVGPASA
jgi:hypothetical protein